MALFHFIFFSSVLGFAASYCLTDYLQQINRQFEQKTDQFWKFDEESSTWIEVQLPYDLLSCVNGNCTKVGSIDRKTELDENRGTEEVAAEIIVVPRRKRISLIRMSETSIWVTGESGAIYERYWNGVQWVIAPHDLPILAGHAVSVFIVNQTILALSEAGILYQLKLGENSQPIWVAFKPDPDSNMTNEAEQSSVILIKSGSISHDGT